MTVIFLDDVVKIYSVGNTRVQALRGFNLEVYEGEFLAIMGPSGSGKTTLLNIIGCIDKPTGGKVRIRDIDISDLSDIEMDSYRLEQVGYIFQTLNLISSLSASENIEIPMVAANLNFEYIRKRTYNLLELVGLESRADHMPNQLSGGERQRIAIAMALSNDPWLILADEPTGDLDSENAKTIANYLRKCVDELGKTVILVTHDSMMARYADRICLISDGKVQSIHSSTDSEDLEKRTYDSHLRKRLEEIDIELEKLNASFKRGVVEGQTYTEEYRKLTNVRIVLRDELHRMGY